MTCDLVNIIPASLYVQSASDVLDVMGWSGYPNPMHVTDLDGPGMVSAMARINANLASSKKVAEKYGRGDDGKYIKVALILETAEAYSYPAEMAIQDAFTHAFFARLLTEEYLLGVLYYEPMYGRAYFEGGKAAFYTEDGIYKVFAKRTAQTFYSYVVFDQLGLSLNVASTDMLVHHGHFLPSRDEYLYLSWAARAGRCHLKAAKGFPWSRTLSTKQEEMVTIKYRFI
jgi:hypothetical protein